MVYSNLLVIQKEGTGEVVMLYKLSNDQPVLKGEGHFIAPSADIIGRVILHSRVSVWFNVVLRADMGEYIEIGEGTNIQDGCIGHLDRDKPLIVGRRVIVGHKSVLHGCTIGDNCLIGMGSVILSGAVIGENSLIGAGSLVTQTMNIPSGSLVMGSPAKVIKKIGPAVLARIRENGAVYEELAAQYLKDLSPC
jgi:carbonic anhydrase/acetyltransferase-like protein (isoleucine patch superfamily)